VFNSKYPSAGATKAITYSEFVPLTADREKSHYLDTSSDTMMWGREKSVREGKMNCGYCGKEGCNWQICRDKIPGITVGTARRAYRIIYWHYFPTTSKHQTKILTNSPKYLLNADVCVKCKEIFVPEKPQYKYCRQCNSTYAPNYQKNFNGV